MKVKAYLLQLNTPTKNGTCYSKEAIEQSMESFIGKPVTIEFDSTKQIGVVEDVYLEYRNDSLFLIGEFTLNKNDYRVDETFNFAPGFTCEATNMENDILYPTKIEGYEISYVNEHSQKDKLPGTETFYTNDED